MGHLVAADIWNESDRLAMQLQDELPDEFAVVAGCIVGGQALDTVVVGRSGVVVLHCRGWEGVVKPSRRGAWRERSEGGKTVQHRNPAAEAKSATKALRAFLHDEFPDLDPPIHHMVVLTKEQASLEGAEATEPPVVATSTVAQSIAALVVPSGKQLKDPDLRSSLAQALGERRLTVSQRAEKPFLFGSGGKLFGGRKVWTVRDAIRHMDRHPDAGVIHLYDGSLAGWLSDQGAEHIARMARDTVRHSQLDQRDGLEAFLIATGMVRRPRLMISPRKVNLGHALSGDTAICLMRIRKGRGRGRLFGTITTSDRWLKVTPERFSGSPVVVKVSAEAQALAVGRGAVTGQVHIDSNASEQHLVVPAAVRVVGVPSWVTRALLRPAIGLLTAGLLGCVLGLAVARWGLPAPEWLTGLTTPPMSAAAVWMALLGLVWGIAGWLRGRWQPLAWPTGYALGRWLLRLLCWSIAIGVIALFGHWAWRSMGSPDRATVLDARAISVTLFAVAAAIFPAVLGEARYRRKSIEDPSRDRWRTMSRPLLLAVVGIVLSAAVVAGGHYVGTAWEQLEVRRRAASAQEWFNDQWSSFDNAVQRVADRLYLWFYDRRAPVSPTPAPDDTIVGASEGET